MNRSDKPTLRNHAAWPQAHRSIKLLGNKTGLPPSTGIQTGRRVDDHPPERPNRDPSSSGNRSGGQLGRHNRPVGDAVRHIGHELTLQNLDCVQLAAGWSHVPVHHRFGGHQVVKDVDVGGYQDGHQRVAAGPPRAAHPRDVADRVAGHRGEQYRRQGRRRPYPSQGWAWRSARRGHPPCSRPDRGLQLFPRRLLEQRGAPRWPPA